MREMAERDLDGKKIPQQSTSSHPERMPAGESVDQFVQSPKLSLAIIIRPNCSGCHLLEVRTLSNGRVQEELASHWKAETLMQGNTKLEALHIIWYPTIVAFAQDGTVLKREEGYLPAYEFLPFLALARVRHLLVAQQPNSAAALLAETAASFPHSGWVPEILYYQGVAAHLSGQRSIVAKFWKSLRTQYPASQWAHKVSVQWNPSPDTSL